MIMELSSEMYQLFRPSQYDSAKSSYLMINSDAFKNVRYPGKKLFAGRIFRNHKDMKNNQQAHRICNET